MVKCSKRLTCGRRCSRKAATGRGCCWQHGSGLRLIGGGSKRKRSRSRSRKRVVGGLKVSKPGKFGKPKRGQWTIYGHQMCPYTARAFEHLKMTLAGRGSQKLIFYDLGVIKSESLVSLRNYLAEYLGSHGSMPMIFDSKGIFVGGYSDLVGQ